MFGAMTATDWATWAGVALAVVIPAGGYLARRYRGKMDVAEVDPPELPTSPLRILVIDDKKFAHVRRLQQEGYRVTTRYDIDSFADVADYKFDILLMDLQGVGSSISASGGIGIVEHLRETSPSQAIIAYSAHEGHPETHGSVHANADIFLNKGSDFAVFRKAIKDTLESLETASFYTRNGFEGAPANKLRKFHSEIELRLQNQYTTEGTAAFAKADDHYSSAQKALKHATAVGQRLHGS